LALQKSTTDSNLFFDLSGLVNAGLGGNISYFCMSNALSLFKIENGGKRV